jgi:SAM-dependent methyltransferase
MTDELPNQQPERLTTVGYWEQGHGGGAEELRVDASAGESAPWWRRDASDYQNFLVWRRLDMHLPRGSHLRFLEVGAAPGRNLVQFRRRFGYDPYGVEYTDAGMRLMEATLRAHGIPESHAIHADFFAEGFQAAHRESFDVVGSFGFLEHFGRPKEVVRKHLDLVKPGGTLVITIPNFRYLNYYLKAFYNKSFIPTHNLDLMDPDVFSRCFQHDDFKVAFCGPVGSFQFPQPSHTARWKRLIEKVLGKVQLAANATLRATAGERAPESRYFSAQLMCIGSRKEGSSAT